MKKQIIIVALTIIITQLICGCNDTNNKNPETERLVGEWTEISAGNTLILYSDGTMKSVSSGLNLSTPGTWEIKNNTIIFYATIQGEYQVWPYYYELTNNDNTLITTLVENTNVTVEYRRN